ncbi:MAG TPA: glycosyltransferase family 1 protein [Methanofastidiosum sp.]|nr:glycosyltransferase family 1 protein [Methanofastidiosum sp.]
MEHSFHRKRKPKVLFITKYREAPYEDNDSPEECGDNKRSFSNGLISGLFNSARFVVDSLNENDVEAKLVTVIDNNSIDKEVFNYKPTHVIIEAFWVVPEKFEILHKLHPNVLWIIRNHSEIPFLAAEGMSMDWISKYTQYANVYLACNSPRACQDVKIILHSARPELSYEEINNLVIYLPNCYPTHVPKKKEHDIKDNVINIMCCGAIRYLKNQLAQAIAAIKFADDLGYTLHFHINSTRVETQSNPVLRNIRKLFENSIKHKLVEHGWVSHGNFLELIKTMDMGMQVSFTETFNIVTADMVICNLPVVVSNEVTWATFLCKADPNNIDNIVETMKNVWELKDFGFLQSRNITKLTNFVEESIILWKEFLND